MTAYNVASFLREQAAARPDAPALRFPAATYRTDAPAWDEWTFGELSRHADAYARGFRAMGLVAGEKVVLLTKPDLHFYAFVFGLFEIGAVPVLLDPGMGRKAILACVAQIRPTAMVALPAVHALRQVIRAPFSSIVDHVTVGRRWFWGGKTLAQCYVPGDVPPGLVIRDGLDDAAIIFTSGSTGIPKGVVNRQDMFAAQVSAIREMFGFEPGNVMVQAFAAFALFDLCWGHCAVIPKMDLSKPVTADPADFAAAVHHNRANVAFASPIVWQNVLRHLERSGTKLDTLERVVTVGAPIPAYLHRRLQPFLAPGAQIWTPYGATEGMPVTQIGTTELLSVQERQKRGEGVCVGRPAPGAEIRIIRVTDDPIPAWIPDLHLGPNQVGEIVVCGTQISTEYRDLPDAQAKAKIRDGDRIWHRMGDLGRIDDDGRLWFAGRKAHRLTTKMGMIPCVPVEQVFNEHPAVFRTALVGLGAPGDERPVLCVELEQGHTWSPALEAELRAMAVGTPWEGVVQALLPHPGFPTDARHNSKIRNEDLKVWAASQGLRRAT